MVRRCVSNGEEACVEMGRRWVVGYSEVVRVF